VQGSEAFTVMQKNWRMGISMALKTVAEDDGGYE
jgi:hypothetical protein